MKEENSELRIQNSEYGGGAIGESLLLFCAVRGIVSHQIERAGGGGGPKLWGDRKLRVGVARAEKN